MKISKNKFNQLKQYTVKKIADKEGVFLLEGKKGIEEALQSDYEVLGVYLLDKYFQDNYYSEIISLAQKENVELAALSDIEVDKLSQLVNSPGLLALVKRKTPLKELSGSILVLDRINDPGNLGTIMRTAAWFGVKNIILSEGSVNQYNSKVIRSSMGAFFNVNVWENVYLPKFLKEYKSNKYKVIAADAHKSDMDIKDFSKIKGAKVIYLFGSESHGLENSLHDFVDDYFTIEKLGTGESLNLAVSVGIMFGFRYLK